MKPTGVIIVDGCEDLEIIQEGLDRANKKIQATIQKRIEPKPEFVPPPPCIRCTTDWGDIDDATEASTNKGTVIFFSLALNLILVVVLGWVVK